MTATKRIIATYPEVQTGELDPRHLPATRRDRYVRAAAIHTTASQRGQSIAAAVSFASMAQLRGYVHVEPGVYHEDVRIPANVTVEFTEWVELHGRLTLCLGARTEGKGLFIKPPEIPPMGLFSTADMANSWMYRMWSEAGTRRTRPVGDFVDITGEQMRGTPTRLDPIWKRQCEYQPIEVELSAESISALSDIQGVSTVDEVARYMGPDADRFKEACSKLSRFATVSVSCSRLSVSFAMIVAGALRYEKRAGDQDFTDALRELAEANNRALKSMADFGIVADKVYREAKSAPDLPPHPFDRSQPRGRRGRRKR